VLAIGPFRRLWIAQLVSVFGDFLAVFAVFAMATFQLHATPAQITFILAAYLFPLAVISPPAGVLVDRIDLKRTMIVSDVLRAALAVLLLFAREMWQIYLIFFCLGILSSFFFPAQSVMLRRMVPVHGLLTANSLMSQTMQVTQMVTPALAGVLVARIGPNLCFGFDIASFLFSAAMVYAIPVSGAHPAEAKGVASLLQDLTSGLRFIFTHRVVSFVMISMTAGMFAMRCFGALIAVFVRDVLHSGASLFGILSSFIGVGMICGTQVLYRAGAGRPKSRLVSTGLLAAGVSILLMSILPTVAASFAGMLGVGMGMAAVLIPSQTLLQQVTPPHMLGRVSSSLMSSLAMAQVVSMVISGSVAESIGIRNLYLASGVALVAIAAAGLRRMVSEPAETLTG
jgi:MFS family permease